MNVLCVCAGGIQRSPTVAKYLKKRWPHLKTKFCGTHYGYPDMLSQENVDWADTILTMDLEQELIIWNRFNKQTVTLGISDQYDPDDPKITELLDFYFEFHWLLKHGLDEEETTESLLNENK